MAERQAGDARGEADHTAGTAIFVRLASRPVPRVARMMRSATAHGLRPLFLGAVRADGLPRRDQWDGFDILRIGPVHPLLNGHRPWTYLLGVLRFNRALLTELRRQRPELVHASDVESAFACIVYSQSTRTPLLYNCHDNLADRYQVPRAIRHTLNTIEGLVILCSTVTLVPETFRCKALPTWCQRRIQVVRNSPHDTGATSPRSPRDGRVRILYAGWLDWGRGIGALLELAGRNPWIEVWMAGEGDPEIVEAIRESKATYLGYLDHSAVMTATAQCDFVAALYDPARPINRAAAPNKMAEAFCTGRPVIVNSEVSVAEAPELSNCTLRVPYAEVSGIAELIRSVVDADGGALYEEMCRNARAVYESQYSWLIIQQIVDSIYTSVGHPDRPVVES